MNLHAFKPEKFIFALVAMVLFVPVKAGVIASPIPWIGVVPGANTGPCPQIIPGTPPVFVLGGIPAPCDSICAGPAFQTWGANISQAMNDLAQVQQDKTQAVQDAVQELTSNWTPTVSNAHTTFTQEYLKGLGASANRIELAWTTQTKAIERAADHMVQTLINSIKEINIAKGVAKNNAIFGDLAQPVSGDISLSMAPVRVRVRTEEDQMHQAMSSAFSDYISDANNIGKTAGVGINNEILLKELNDLAAIKVGDLITKRVTEKDTFDQYMKYINMIVSTETYPEIPIEEDREEDELNRRIHVQKLTMIYNTLARTLLSVNPTTDVTWKDFYIDPIVNADAKTSTLGLMEAEINGPLEEEDWWGMVSSSNKAGISRSLIYMNAVGAEVNSKRLELTEMKKNLKAIIAMEKVSKAYATN